MHGFVAVTSFIYSGHVMPMHEIYWLMVMTVDLSIIALLLFFAGGIKLFSRRHHITLACRKVFVAIAIASFILYGLFITAVAFINYIQRLKLDDHTALSLFYSECGLLLLYLCLFSIKKLQEYNMCKCFSLCCCCSDE